MLVAAGVVGQHHLRRIISQNKLLVFFGGVRLGRILTLDERKQVPTLLVWLRVVPEEGGMREYLPVLAGADFVEAVQVELAYEGGVIGMLEMFGEDVLGQIGYVLDHEAVALGIP